MGETGLAAWKEHLTETVEVGEGLAIRIRRLNVLTLLGGDGPNPLMGIVGQFVGAGPAEVGSLMLSDPTALAGLREMLRGLLIQVVIEPPLVEQGVEDGVSVDEIPLEAQLAVFGAVFGGEDLLRGAERFPAGSAAAVVAAPDGGAVRAKAQRAGRAK